MKFRKIKNFAFASIISAISLSFTAHSGGYYIPMDDDEGEYDSPNVVAEDIYELKIKLRVPQVVNNTKSLGTRKFQKQSIKGNMHVLWNDDGTYSFEFSNLVNSKFKVGGKYVTYGAFVNYDKAYPRFSWIGNNLKNRFTKPTMYFDAVFEPSYAKGSVDEDNSFYLSLSGSGSSTIKNGSSIAKRISGKTSGTQGCGCSSYGHVSPSRTAGLDGPTDEVTDVVETEGTWKMRWKKRIYYTKKK